MQSAGVRAVFVVLAYAIACEAAAQENLLANPGFEKLLGHGFFADWDQGGMRRVNKTLFVATDCPHTGRYCLRMKGTPNTWTTCSARPITVDPDTTYWITWWFKSRQPASSRTYLFCKRIWPSGSSRRPIATGTPTGPFVWSPIGPSRARRHWHPC